MKRDGKIIREDYLDFLRKKPCLVCGRGPVDVDHLQAVGWRESKRNDWTAVNLCREHHAERHKLGIEQFQEKYRSIKLNLWEEASRLIVEFIVEREAGEKG